MFRMVEDNIIRLKIIIKTLQIYTNIRQIIKNNEHMRAMIQYLVWFIYFSTKRLFTQ